MSLLIDIGILLMLFPTPYALGPGLRFAYLEAILLTGALRVSLGAHVQYS